MNGVQTRLKCKPNVKQCKRLVFPARSVLFSHNILNAKAISYFQVNHILIRFVFPPLRTNVEGFIRMVTAAFDYFKKTKNGHIAVISSIAGTKGLGVAPAYSATKRFQNTYIDALAQLARMQHLNIRFTDIRPGFVATDLLRNGKYPMLMHADKVAEYIVRALKHKKRVTVIDGRYRLLVFFWRMIPRWLWERLPIRN